MIPECKKNNANYKKLENRVDKLSTYSTEEQVIGTWINGKPIYRKYIITNSPSNINTDEVIAELPSEEETLVYFYSKVYIPILDTIVPVPYLFNTENFGILWFNPNTKQFLMKVTNTFYTNIETTIIVEYTKATD